MEKASAKTFSLFANYGCLSSEYTPVYHQCRIPGAVETEELVVLVPEGWEIHSEHGCVMSVTDIHGEQYAFKDVICCYEGKPAFRLYNPVHFYIEKYVTLQIVSIYEEV